jgi:Flp pilus assembly protein TadG
MDAAALMIMKRRNFLLDASGTSAIEFAFVGPVFLMLVVGMMYGCMMIYSLASLHYAVEEGARCASVKATVCTNSTTIIAYTQTAYNGPAVVPTFTYATPACGKAVTGTASFAFNMGLASWSVPLTATACYP